MQRVMEAVVLSLAAVWLALSFPTHHIVRGVDGTGLLPPSIDPEYYDISLEPNRDQGVFHGVVTITGVAVAASDRVVVHCRGLVFNTSTVTVVDLTADQRVDVEGIEEDKELQQCHILLNQSLEVEHEYSLTVEFMGVIGKDGVGLYRDSYMEEGIKREMLVTHFQPNHARAVFPCWDEPHYKAHFLLRVKRQDFPTVLSNMPATRDSRIGWVQFEETPPMSPYLLVLVMCDYLALSDVTTNTTVWAPRARLHEAQLALNISVAVLEYCESYFGTQYPLPKLDHIAVPRLSSVAMENWGAITYKESFLLWEEGVSTWAEKEMIASVISHEIIHQWLGNLVTTIWWNTTWLNEGVTSFYHYHMLDKIEPSWNVMDNMFITQIFMILDTEAVGDHRPLTSNTPLPEDSIGPLAFSVTTYLKGAAIVRMVYNLMTPDVFREAISQYILDNEYGSVDEEDLWQSLAMVADLPVDLEEVMGGWTHQQGYPLVTVHRGPDGCLSLTQRYLGDQESDANWTIPLTYTTSSELDFNLTNTLWFPGDHAELDLDVCLEPTDWIIVNIRQSGFYRTNYDPQTWQALTHDLLNCDLSDIHPVNRAQLLHDGFFLTHQRLLEYPVILNLSLYLRRETEYLPWSVAVGWLAKMHQHFFHTEIRHQFVRYARGLVDPPLSALSLSGEAGGMLQELHRRTLVEFACGLAHPRCVKEATDTVYLLMSGVQVEMPVELQTAMLCAAVRHGQAEVWHWVLKQYQGSRPGDRRRYLPALACTRDHRLRNRTLKAVATSGSFLKSSDERLQLFVEITSLPDSFQDVLTLVLENYRSLSADFDCEILLNILSNNLPPYWNKEEIHKFDSLAALVSKQSPTKNQIEILYKMAKYIRAPRGQLLDESARQWFAHFEDHDEDGDNDDDDDDSTEHNDAQTTTTTDASETLEENNSDENVEIDKTTSEESLEDKAATVGYSGCSPLKVKTTRFAMNIFIFLIQIGILHL